MICNVLQSQKLLRESGLEIERIEGPPSRQSRNVIVHYRIADDSAKSKVVVPEIEVPLLETPEARAERVVNALRGLLKNEIAAFGGAEAFMKWVRSEEDEAA